jgi:hypothetical protein
MEIVDRIVEEWDKKAGGMLDGAEAELKNLWGKARSKVTGKIPPDDRGKTITLEARPEDVKVLYTRVLALQALVDGRLDPREIEYLYVFMSRVGLSPDSREEVRRFMQIEDVAYEDVVELVDEVVSWVPDNQDEIAVSIIKELLQISRSDGAMLPQEEASMQAVAEARFGERAERVIELAEKTVKYEEALVNGNVGTGELERHVKEIAACATAASVPITALFFSGSVVGLSAAGITSGLAALGLGGVLGLSAMVTGIGVVVVIGVTAYAAARWAMGGKDRELRKQREHMIQEIIKRHQGAIENLAEDQNTIAMKLAEYVSKSYRNEAKLARLKVELQMFTAALAEVQQKKDDLKSLSEQHAV